VRKIDILRHQMPKVPWELQDTVELYARESGRHAKLHLIPGGGYFARLTLRDSDKRLSLVQSGKTEELHEDVWFNVPNPNQVDGVSLAQLKSMGLPFLWPMISMVNGRCRQNYLPLDVRAMGVEGIKEFLERGNMWSGRGEFNSPEEQLRKAREWKKDEQAKFKAFHNDENRMEQRSKRRWRFKIPFVPVLKDIGSRANESS